jgi:hypothetical protein
MQVPGTRLLLAALLAAGAAVYAQDTQGQDKPPVNTGTVIKTETRLVVVDAVVTDKKDNYVRTSSRRISRSSKTARTSPSRPFPTKPIRCRR